MGFQVIGIDLVPKMIENAQKIALNKNLKINYQIDDATNLHFEDNSFDYALFSNNGWSQIPGQENRLKALEEIYRILKPDGFFLFTAHPRIFNWRFSFLWIKQWLKFYLLKNLGVKIAEQDFGDRFFARETRDANKTYKTKQYIHIPSIKEVQRELGKTQFKIIEINERLQISNEKFNKYPAVVYVCQK